MIERRAQSAWLVALVLGAVAGVFGLIMPVAGPILAVSATSLALLLGRPRVFGLGGAWLGFGGMWSIFLLRAGFDCVAAPVSSDGCSSQLFQTYLIVGILMAIVGLLVTALASRGGRTA